MYTQTDISCMWTHIYIYIYIYIYTYDHYDYDGYHIMYNIHKYVCI